MPETNDVQYLHSCRTKSIGSNIFGSDLVLVAARSEGKSIGDLLWKIGYDELLIQGKGQLWEV